MQIHRVLSIKYSTQGDHVLSPTPRSTYAYLLLPGTYLVRQKENVPANPRPTFQRRSLRGFHPLPVVDRCFTSGRLSFALITFPSGARLTSFTAFIILRYTRSIRFEYKYLNLQFLYIIFYIFLFIFLLYQFIIWFKTTVHFRHNDSLSNYVQYNILVNNRN